MKTVPRSAIYEGSVRHRRFGEPAHGFRQRLFMMLLDLGELPGVFDGMPGWSARGFAPAWFRRADYLGDPAQPLDTAVRDLVAERTGRRPEGRIELLTHLRYWGYVFNPISLYYCYAPDSTALEAVVAEVSNTPWGERHCYVLSEPVHGSGARPTWHFAKRLHVSPFMPMDATYRLRARTPGEHLSVHIEMLRSGDRTFDATLLLRRRELSAGTLSALWLRYPFMTGQVVAGIYWQAWRLWRKGAPYVPRPGRDTPNGRNGGTPGRSVRKHAAH